MSAPPAVDGDVPAEAPERPAAAVLQLRIDRAAVLPAIAVLLVAGHLILRAWAAAGGWLTGPDFLAAAVAAGLPVDTAGPPGAALLARGVAAVAPLSWPALVSLELLAQLLVDLALYRLLVELFGRRSAVLLPLTVYLTSSLTLVGGVWWSAALVQLPLQLALLTAVSGHVRHLRSRARAPMAASALAVAVGVLFAVEAALVPLLLLAGTALWATAGSIRGRLRVLAELRVVWAVQAVAAAVGIGARLVLSGDPLVDADALAAGVRGLPDVVTHTVLPGLIGGPLTWAPEAVPLASPAPPTGLVWAAAVSLGVVVLAAVLIHRGAVRAWLVAAGAVVVLLLGNAASGLSERVGPAASGGLVPPAGAALVVAVALGLAFLPVHGGPVVLRRRAWTTRAAGRRVTAWLSHPGGALAVAATLVVGCVVSTTGFERYWSTNAAQDFVVNARADLTGRTELVVADAAVPAEVVPAALAPANRTSVVLAGLPRLPAFLVEGQIVDELVTLDEEGHGQLAVVDPVAASGQGPVEDCGWLAAADAAEVPLPRETPDGRWLVQITYFAGAGNLVTVRAGDTVGGGAADAGVHNLFMSVSGSVDRVVVEVGDAQSPLCVASVAVGHPVALSPAGY